MKKFKILFVMLLILLFSILGFGIFYNYEISAVSNKSEEVTVTIEEGSVYSVGNILLDEGLIRNKFIYKLYVKVNGISSIKASTYLLNKNMNLKEIVDILKKGNSYNPDEVKITFKEGLNVRKIAKIVEECTNNSYDDFLNIMNDRDYIDNLINKYWFLTEDIKNDKIYYPLEGYLFPNTYFLKSKDVSIGEIVETMLDETDKQLSKYRNKIEDGKYSVHEIMTLASIVELEGAKSNDRKGVAGVFYNRLEDNWVLGSDVTTYYFLKIDDFKISLNGNPDLYKCDNAYNTRCTSFTGLPVGPISNPGHDSIDSTINYTKHDYYYFVADCSGKTYLNKDFTGHSRTINKLKNENNWCA